MQPYRQKSAESNLAESKLSDDLRSWSTERLQLKVDLLRQEYSEAVGGGQGQQVNLIANELGLLVRELEGRRLQEGSDTRLPDSQTSDSHDYQEGKVPRPGEARHRHHGGDRRRFRRGPNPKRLIFV